MKNLRILPLVLSLLFLFGCDLIDQIKGLEAIDFDIEIVRSVPVDIDEDDPLTINETFTLDDGWDKQGTLGIEIDIYVDGNINTSIHTSCSEPIYVGMVSGDFMITAGESKDGGALGEDCELTCETPAPALNKL